MSKRWPTIRIMMPTSRLEKTQPDSAPAPDPRARARAGLEPGSLESRVARAAGSPLVRGGLTIVAGIVTGNILGFARVALTAYFLGTRSAADSLAVAIGPIDTLSEALINTIIFGFVLMLTELQGAARGALFLKVKRLFTRFFIGLTAAMLILAPQLTRVLAPGLPPEFVPQAIAILRIGALSIMAVGITAIYSALLYTGRRFAPSAFHQATLNALTIVCALSLWKVAGIYGFAIGYLAGTWTQFAIVYWAARSELPAESPAARQIQWRRVVSHPRPILGF